MVKTRSFLAMALAFAMVLPASAGTARQKQELEQLARDLNARLGAGTAEVRGRVAPPRVALPTGAAHLNAESLVDAMNRERAARGLSPLRLNQRLSLAASDRLTDMFAKRYFDHVSPDGLS